MPSFLFFLISHLKDGEKIEGVFLQGIFCELSIAVIKEEKVPLSNTLEILSWKKSSFSQDDFLEHLMYYMLMRIINLL